MKVTPYIVFPRRNFSFRRNILSEDVKVPDTPAERIRLLSDGSLKMFDEISNPLSFRSCEDFPERKKPFR